MNNPPLELSGIEYRSGYYDSAYWERTVGHNPAHYPRFFKVHSNQLVSIRPEGIEFYRSYYEINRINLSVLTERMRIIEAEI